jgi:DNA primase catalytic core
MERESVDFIGAIKLIASLMGIESPIKEKNWSSIKESNNPLELSFMFFKNQLLKSNAALDYLQVSRKLNMETISSLGIGYAPADHRVFADFVQEHPNIDFGAMLNEAGYPKLLGRIVFPIFSRQGEIDNFIGRSLRDTPPKYYKVLNQSHLYGINNLYKGKGPVIVVEGPMDFAAMYQNRLRSVSLLGTGMIRRDSVSILRSYGKKLYLALDPDEAGCDATLKAMKILYRCGFIPFVVPLEDDPDVTILRDGKDLFLERLKGSKSGAEWIAHREKGMDAVELFTSIIMCSPDPTIRSIERKVFSDALGVDLREIKPSRDSSEYRTFILSSVKLYDDLYEKVMLGSWPDWLKDEVINSPPPSKTSLSATHKEVEIGLNRLLHTIS